MLLCVLLSALCLFSIGMVWKEYADRGKDKEIFGELAELVVLPEETTAPVTETEATDTAETVPDEAAAAETELTGQKRNLTPIMEQNSECIGWICIEGTAVDYPVMYTPNDPQKYLRRNFYGEYSVSGIPFLDYRCSIDSTNLIIYGHNMKNGTMFSDLKKYLDSTFRAEHSTIELETAEGVRYFTVTEVITTDIYDGWYDRLEYEDGRQLLILSTCYGTAKTGRLLIVAVET